MAERHYTMQLSGLTSRDGQIAFTELAELAGKLQAVTRRLARQLGGSEGPGRSPATLDDLSRLTLTGLSPGSTVLEFDLGDPDTLALPGEMDDQIADRFEEIVAGLAANRRPDWVSPPVGDAVEDLAHILKSSRASNVRLTRDGTLVALLVPPRVDSTVWLIPRARDQRQATVSGTLFAVNTHARRFRLTDDLGNDITLVEVEDPESVARLVTGRVSASGAAEFDEHGKLRQLVAPTLRPFDLPDAWRRPEPHVPLLVGGSLGNGIPGLTDDEVDDFLASM